MTLEQEHVKKVIQMVRLSFRLDDDGNRDPDRANEVQRDCQAGHAARWGMPRDMPRIYRREG